MSNRLEQIPLDRELTNEELQRFLYRVLGEIDGMLDPKGGTFTDSVYPVGSIYTTTATSDPKEIFGGMWEEVSSPIPDIHYWKRTL